MKRLLIVVFILAVCVPVHALTYSAYDDSAFENGYQWGGHAQKDKARIWAKDMESAVAVGGQLSTGKVWYVDSGRSASGDGKSWIRAVITLEEANVLSLADGGASRGDFFLLAPGHNEGLTGAGIDIDTAGVTIIGYGNGALKPIIDFDAIGAIFAIGAANVRIENIRFRASSETTVALDIEDAGDNFTLAYCEFGWAESAGVDEFATAVNIKDNVDDGLIIGCKFRGGAAEAVQAIKVVSSTAGLDLIGNHIQGNYSAGCIIGSNGDYAENLIVKGNTCFQGTMSGDGEINTVVAMSFADGSSGLVANNIFVANVAAGTAFATRTGDDMVFVNNFITNVDGDEFSGTIESNGSSVTATPSA